MSKIKRVKRGSRVKKAVRIDSLSIGSILSNTILYRWRIDWPVIVAKPVYSLKASRDDLKDGSAGSEIEDKQRTKVFVSCWWHTVETRSFA